MQNSLKNLANKKILIGITGGIAAYKTCELIRILVKHNAIVKTIITPCAKEFVTETTLRTLTQNPVYSEQFKVNDWKPEHINLADEADLMIIAPASANTLGKIANGICDNLLTSVITAFSKPIIIAPAMNSGMWKNKFVQQNIADLAKAGFYIMEPEEGELACGYNGKGRMAKVENIASKTVEIFCKLAFLKDKKIVITAGGTKEPIDPVRFIGNHSSGKMGFALADLAYEYGADVVLISTVKAEKPYKVINVNTALEMFEEVKKEFKQADSIIMAAAVADYRTKTQEEHKIKKENTDSLTLELVKNPDIISEIAINKKENQIIIGFCAESQNLYANAEKKLKEKNLDYIVANDISNPEIGFNSDYNEATLLSKEGKQLYFNRMTKKELAKNLLENIFKW